MAETLGGTPQQNPADAEFYRELAGFQEAVGRPGPNIFQRIGGRLASGRGQRLEPETLHHRRPITPEAREDFGNRLQRLRTGPQPETRPSTLIPAAPVNPPPSEGTRLEAEIAGLTSLRDSTVNRELQEEYQEQLNDKREELARLQKQTRPAPAASTLNQPARPLTPAQEQNLAELQSRLASIDAHIARLEKGTEPAKYANELNVLRQRRAEVAEYFANLQNPSEKTGVSVSGIAEKETYGRLKVLAAAAGYVINPVNWPRLTYHSAKGWVETTFHPIVTLKKAATGKLDSKEVAFYAGAAEGAIEQFALYTALPPGAASLVRAGLGAAIGAATVGWAYGPQAAAYLYRIGQEKHILKITPGQAEAAVEIERKQAEYARGADFLRNFSRGRSAAYTYGALYRAFTPGGAAELLVEKGIQAAGLNMETLGQKITAKATPIPTAGPTTIVLDRVAQAELVVNSDNFNQAVQNLQNDTELQNKIGSFNRDSIAASLQGTAVRESIPYPLANQSQAFYQTLYEESSKRTSEWAMNRLREWTKEALIKDPNLTVDQAIQQVKSKLPQALDDLQDNPEEYQKWIQQINQTIIAQARATLAEATATPVPPTAKPPAIPPASTPGLQTPPEHISSDDAWSRRAAAQPSGPAQPSGSTPDMEARRSNEAAVQAARKAAEAQAAQGPAPAMITPEFGQASAQLNLDKVIMSEETYTKVRDRFNQQFARVPEANRQDVLNSLKQIVLSETKAAAVGANMAAVDKATNEAINTLGITDQASGKTRQTIHEALQIHAEQLADKSMKQASTELQGDSLNNIIEATRRQFGADLQSTLDAKKLQVARDIYASGEVKNALAAHQADFEKAAKEGVAEALKNRADTHTVISPLIYDHAVEVAKDRASSIAWLKIVSDNVTKVDVADPDQAHLQKAVQAAAAEGRKQFEAQLARPDSLELTHDHIAVIIDYHLGQDQIIKDKINQVLVEVNPGHGIEPTAVEPYTPVTIKPGQTVSHIFLEAKQPLHFNSTDARPLAAFIAANYDQLADMHYAFEQAGNLEADNFYPVNLDNLYNIMIAAESGNIDARRKLMQAVWMIQAGKNVKLVSIENQARIINILGKYRWSQK